MIDSHRFDELLRRAIDEDLGAAGDITSSSIFSVEHLSTGRIVARQAGVIAGVSIAQRVFELIDDRLTLEPEAADGLEVEAGTELMALSGSTKSILAAERTALNILGRLSGIATATAELVELVDGTGTMVCDTRKTTPTLRALEKYAVRMGGGSNHRFGLYDTVMIKDNHIVAAGGIGTAVALVRAHVGHTVKIEVEVDDLAQLRELLIVGADIVLLDNMSIDEIEDAVEMVDGRMIIEASGGIDRDSIRAVAETGVDVISVGALTHSAPSLDVALDLD